MIIRRSASEFENTATPGVIYETIAKAIAKEKPEPKIEEVDFKEVKKK